MNRLYKYAGDEDSQSAPKSNESKGLNAGDWGYAAVGAGLGGGAGWLLGRLIHGNQYKEDKLKQLTYALGGAGAGGLGGLFGGSALANAFAGDEDEGGELKDPVTGKEMSEKEYKALEYARKKGKVKIGTSIIGGGLGLVGGSKLGNWGFDISGRADKILRTLPSNASNLVKAQAVNTSRARWAGAGGALGTLLAGLGGWVLGDYVAPWVLGEEAEYTK